MVNDAISLVIGLGNPGPQYAGNRHNIGYLVVEELAKRHAGSFSAHQRSGAQVAAVRLGMGPGGVPGPRVLLVKTGTFMNVSGGPVSALAQYFAVAPADVYVVHDELDIPFGQIRLKLGGGEGGHNGLRSISKSLGTKDYYRVRTGVGRPPGKMDAATFVLKDFSTSERPELPFLVQDAADATEMLLQQGLTKAQLHYHTAT